MNCKQYIMTANQKTKRERFETVASKRVQRILDDLDLLSNCANKNNYEYGDNDIQKMFHAIKEKLKNAEAIFTQKTNKKNRSFSF